MRGEDVDGSIDGVGTASSSVLLHARSRSGAAVIQNVYAVEMGAALCCRRPRRVQDESSTVTNAGKRGTQSPPIGRVLVFVNPKSGSGKSLATFRDRVEPKLKKNHIDYDVVITSGPNHAKSAIRLRDDLGKYNGIIILSGDGLVFEVSHHT
ncbi:unnamed protein product [Haemonchus placei]|uniref:DAGKc domain-containing protein n=1 Tax=Haemonchus placei TaxID=6290 RepID=A0A0N4VTN5_HAEPC|nr:unnamed protein product [Haemonchus placei]